MCSFSILSSGQRWFVRADITAMALNCYRFMREEFECIIAELVRSAIPCNNWISCCEFAGLLVLGMPICARVAPLPGGYRCIKKRPCRGNTGKGWGKNKMYNLSIAQKRRVFNLRTWAGAFPARRDRGSLLPPAIQAGWHNRASGIAASVSLQRAVCGS